MKILIVEDDVISAKKLEYLIKSLGYETLVAKDGDEGYELWKKEKPRIVITDWVMPKLDGLELCQKIRKSGLSQYTYLIIVTSKNNKEDIVVGMNAGADDFISKPYLKEELAVRINAGKRIVELESRDVIIMAISKLAESRDDDTSQHLERIRYYSKALATNLKDNGIMPEVIDEIFIDNIFLTSMLHDIGKMGIPDRILLKPGKLTVDEFEIMKTHSKIGYETLREAAKAGVNAQYLIMSAEIALSHHEKFDGSGYPEGLKGKDIPISARIVALADVYDALVNKRVYKEAFSHEKAKEIILDSSGSHFDPDVVVAFERCEDEFKRILGRYQD